MIKLKADRNLRKLNNLFKLGKDKFWHSINRLHDSKQQINLTIDEVKSHYFKLFNTKNNNSQNLNRTSQELVEEFIELKKSPELSIHKANGLTGIS